VRLHHVALGARDVERLAAFYRDVFGLTEELRHHNHSGALRSVWFRMDDDTRLMIEASSEEARHVEGVGMGPFLLAFAIRPEERDAFEERLVRAGATVESRTGYSSYARDPEGNRIALSHYPDEALDHGG
jgi:catechol 2,3-dioxygenase-like lactoylglutathione lyase family enzyme